MTTTEQILALAMSAGRTVADGTASDRAIEVTDADLAAFREAASRGRDSVAARALLAIRPPAPPSAAAGGGPAWAAWATAAAATAAAGGSVPAPGNQNDGDDEAAGGARLTWLAVFAAGTALADATAGGTAPTRTAADAGPVTVTRAVAAGMSAAAIIESGLADWDGWSPGTIGAAVGASVTAGLLLGLTPSQLRAAIGICATQAAGLRAAVGTDAFALQVGKAAFNGVEAALLARAGFTAPDEPLDGRRGLFALFGR